MNVFISMLLCPIYSVKQGHCIKTPDVILYGESHYDSDIFRHNIASLYETEKSFILLREGPGKSVVDCGQSEVPDIDEYEIDLFSQIIHPKVLRIDESRLWEPNFNSTSWFQYYFTECIELFRQNEELSFDDSITGITKTLEDWFPQVCHERNSNAAFRILMLMSADIARTSKFSHLLTEEHRRMISTHSIDECLKSEAQLKKVWDSWSNLRSIIQAENILEALNKEPEKQIVAIVGGAHVEDVQKVLMEKSKTVQSVTYNLASKEKNVENEENLQSVICFLEKKRQCSE